MRVCHIVPSLEERHGGPSKSVRALANTQVRLGAEVSLLSTTEPGRPAPETSADPARVTVFAREAPLFLCRSRELRQDALRLESDCFHHHSLWLLTVRYAQEAARRRCVPLVLSPRGMLSPWAYRHHRWRKRLTELLVHPGAFASATGWHATSVAEADDIRRLGFRQPICISPNGVELPAPADLDAARAAWRKAHPALAGRRVALFYSRFHRKKRVCELMQLWTSQPRGDWVLLIAGVPEEYTVDELQALAKALAPSTPIVVVDSTGMPPPYAAAELFLLPSHSENFGLVIAEALAAGRAALVTDSTPWQTLDPQSAGRCVAWESYPAALADLLARTPDELSVMGRKARQWAAEEFSWGKAASRLLEFYRQLLHA